MKNIGRGKSINRPGELINRDKNRLIGENNDQQRKISIKEPSEMIKLIAKSINRPGNSINRDKN
ncbi:hypothetical protein ACFQ3N_17475 [Virgibacillus byunsanensis]|uniref:Uncharacterized protein n=1 Tax=Virgibacillus byunsanensis TaxID=570945 RepID=A0ABW3LRZ1_9BACI